MFHMRKPVDWEVFSNPPRHPVQYYSILKKKREFSQLIRQYESQAFKHEYLHYCGIVPKNISSALNNKYELYIIFFDEVPNTSFIGFRVKVSKETFTHESNSLLLFLKRSKKPVFYLMNNNCIHVQCGTNAWELFYLLYDVYLRQYVLTVIGTQFFYHFVYSFCIKKEIQLLELLFKGSKIIRISKKSIYYKIHRKRKISVCNLIHMTLNMPKSKRCIISFDSREALLHSDMRNDDIYTNFGSKIHVTKLVLKKFKKQILDTLHDNAVTNPVASANDSALIHHSEILGTNYEYISDIKNKYVSSSNSTLKRKLEEIENDEYDIHPRPTTSKFLKLSETVCPAGVNENQWERYINIKPYTVKTYSGIPCLKNLVPNLLSNGNSLHINYSDSFLSNDHNHASSVESNMVLPLPSEKEIDLNRDSLTIEETYEMADHSNLHSPTKSDCNNESSLAFKGGTSDKPSNVLANMNYNTLKSISSNLQIINCEKPEFHYAQNASFVSSDIKTSNSVSSPESCNHGKINSSEDVNFMTAAGKTINVSNAALLTALRLIEDVRDDGKQQSLQAKGDSVSSRKRFKKSPNSDYVTYRKSETESMPLGLTGTIPSHTIRGMKGSEITSENLDVDLAENINENYKLDNIDDPDDAIFSTAAGKNIAVSNTAMQAAQKLIQDVFKEESMVTSSTTSSCSKHENKIARNFSAFRNIDFPSKKCIAEEIDIDMDKTLVEKFFEDTVFGEKDLETSETNEDKDSDVVLEPKSDKNLPTRKPRKSLGGRRSMRFCSGTLE